MPICKHFGRCGGCLCPPGTDRPAPYDEELARKEAEVRRLLAPFDVGEWRPILPSPDPWHYRNKMELAFGPGLPEEKGGPKTPLVLGLRRAGSYDKVVDLETCFLMSPEMVELAARARAWALEQGFTGFDRRFQRGDLRYLVVREGKHTGQRLAVLIAGKHTEGRLIDGLPALRERLSPLLTTFWLAFTDAKSDVARTEDTRLIWGAGTIEEKLGGLVFRISPYSFFQTNTRGTERLYGLLQDWAAGLPPAGALIDLYCGAGGIGLSLAGHFDRVVGIDTNKEAIEDAKFNAERNGIGNAEFVAEDAMEFLAKLPGSKLSVQIAAAVVDPPRPGLHPKALAALLELNPPRLAYVSCNPESLARDLQSLAPLYRIASVQPVDLFPHTAHVETIALLEHR